MICYGNSHYLKKVKQPEFKESMRKKEPSQGEIPWSPARLEALGGVRLIRCTTSVPVLRGYAK